MSSMKNSKITIYLPTELAKTIKKHAIDIDMTLSAFLAKAAETQLKEDGSRKGKSRLIARKKADEIDKIISDLSE